MHGKDPKLLVGTEDKHWAKQLSALPAMLIFVSALSLQMDAGTEPESEFESNLMIWTLTRNPNDDGTMPTMLFE